MPTAFFERQDRARQRTLLLLVLFTVVTGGTLLLANVVVLVLLEPRLLAGSISLREAVAAEPAAVILTTAVIAGPPLLAGMGRALALRAGGRAVARALGGEPVKAATRDPAEQRLRNIVEETALAAGVVPPGIYVLSGEPGINAFAAGLRPTDSVIAVTRGALQRLDRHELQGVIAHEFSHIVNGDTRLYTRLIAAIHALEVMATTAGVVMTPGHRTRGSGRTAGASFIGVVLYLLGLAGVFASRLIKAAIVRQREWLADAAAVQFTRYPEGLAGALKKIAAGRRLGSAMLVPERRAVSHMLFAPGLGFADSWLPWLATHPPVLDRIRALEPGFQAADLEAVRAELARMPAVVPDAAEPEVHDEASPASPADPRTLLLAALLRDGAPAADARRGHDVAAAVPSTLREAVHDPEQVIPAVLYLFLHAEAAVRDRQLAAVESGLGAQVRARTVTWLAERDGLVDAGARVPALELAIPALRERPAAELRALAATTGALVRADGRIAEHEFALGRLLQLHLGESIAPAGQRRRPRPVPLHDRADAAGALLAVFVSRAHADDPARAAAAYRDGVTAMLLPGAPEYAAPEDWVRAMGTALDALQALDRSGRRCLVRGLITAACHDRRLQVTEAELLRVVAVALELPLPLLLPGEMAPEAEAEGPLVAGFSPA